MKKLTTFELHLNKRYGRKGTSNRKMFEAESFEFRLKEMLKKRKKVINR
jgi:hypothetical protein